jgi:ATP-dependent DNA ligase
MVKALPGDRRRAALTPGALTAGQGRVAVSLNGRPIAVWWDSPAHRQTQVQTSTDRYWILGGMDLPVMPPGAPMLAKPVPQLPDGPYSFEPKWDGFRTIVLRGGDEVELGSRNERPLTRYFPELVEAIKVHLPAWCVVVLGAVPL